MKCEDSWTMLFMDIGLILIIEFYSCEGKNSMMIHVIHIVAQIVAKTLSC